MIEIFSAQIYDRFNTVPASGLTGAVGAYYKAKIKFYVHWELINVDVSFPGVQIQLSSGSWLTAGFLPGDNILLELNDGSTLTYTILSVDDKFLKTDAPSDLGLSPQKISVYGITSPRAFKFSYSLVENQEPDSYLSRLDNAAKQEFVVQYGAALPVGTPVALGPSYGKKHWITGRPGETGAQITAFNSGTSGIGFGKETYFEIDHIFYADPFLTDDWLNSDGKLSQDLNEQFANGNSPKYIYKIESSTDNINFRFSTVGSNIKTYQTKGTLGWFGFQANGMPSPFSIKSLVYHEDVSGDTVTELLSNAVTRVTMVIEAAAGASFTNDANQFADTYIYEKVPKNIYTNPAKTLFENFNVSFGSSHVGGTATDFHNITNYLITYVDSSHIQITFKYHGDGSVNKYLLYVETQSGIYSDLKATDKSAVIADENSFITFFNTEGVVKAQHRHLEHPFVDFKDGTTDYKGWIEDGVVTKEVMQISKQNNTGQATSLNKIQVNIVADNGTIFRALETADIAIGQNTVRDFKLPTGDLRLQVSLIEETTLETADSKFYTLIYGWKIRFEEWLNQNNAPSAIIPNDNKKWDNYSNKKGYDIKFYTDHYIDFPTGQDIVRLISNVGALTYDQFDSCEIEGKITTFNNTSGVSLKGGTRTFISPDADTKVTSFFDKEGLGCYDFTHTDFYGIIEIYGYRNGTVVTIRQTSTVRDKESDSPFLGLASSGNRALLTKGATIADGVKVEAVILLSQIDPTLQYTISARLGKINPQPSETCNCPPGSTFNTVTSNCDSPSIDYPDSSGQTIPNNLNNYNGANFPTVPSFRIGFGNCVRFNATEANELTKGLVSDRTIFSDPAKFHFILSINFDSISDQVLLFQGNETTTDLKLSMQASGMMNISVRHSGLSPLTQGFYSDDSSTPFVPGVPYFIECEWYEFSPGNHALVAYVGLSSTLTRVLVLGGEYTPAASWSGLTYFGMIKSGVSQPAFPLQAYMDEFLADEAIVPYTTMTHPAPTAPYTPQGNELYHFNGASTGASYPCSCNCVDGFTYDSATHRCIKTGSDTASKEGNIWYFGQKAGVTFNTLNANGDPTYLLDGNISCKEGSTTLCDSDGNLLLYTDGKVIYNGANVLSASGLNGDDGATNASLSIPFPGTTNDYFLFTITGEGNPGGYHPPQYNILRGVTSSGFTLSVGEKNQTPGGLPSAQVIEKQAAMKAAGDYYWWVMRENVNNGRLLAYKIDATGISSTPVFSPLSAVSGSVGVLKFSTDGTKLLVNYNDGGVNYTDLYDWDEISGTISTSKIRLVVADDTYGAEFSPDGTKLYITSFSNGLNESFAAGGIFQFDISSGDQTTIQATKFQVKAGALNYTYGHLQGGPNGRVYCAVTNWYHQSNGNTVNYLGVIRNPNGAGALCDYQENVPLNASPLGAYPSTTTGTNYISLPTFRLGLTSPLQSMPCSGVCSIPDFTLSSACPHIQIDMISTKARSWIVTDNHGSSPITISSNDTYLFGSYTGVTSVEITLTDSHRPECFITKNINLSC